MGRTLLVTAFLVGMPALASARIETGRHLVADDPGVSASMRAQSRTIYLNRTGVTVTPGANDSRLNRSSIVMSPATIPGWNVSSTMWAQTVTCLREMFAPFDVDITETDPGERPHMEAVFGGSPSMLGLSGSFGGVSPFSATCKIIEHSIVFTFTDVIPQKAQAACEVMAQEIAHSYGLDHELLASDPMSYLPYAGARTFQNVTAECGESSPRPCGITGSPMCRPSQNSYALLMERIGAAGTGDIDPPIVAITSPANGAVVDAGFEVTAALADDVGVRLAVLSIDGASISSSTNAPWTFTTPADLLPGKHVIEVMATDGAHEQVAQIEVTVRGDDSEASPVGGCATGGGTRGLFGLLLVGLIAIQRRAQRQAASASSLPRS